MERELRSGQAEFAGHRVAYRVAGHGPALVVLKNDRYSTVSVELRLLSDRYMVVQISPLGFGRSDRPRDYPRAGIHEHVLSVLDHEEVDRFAVWGYSQCGAMAAAVAQATPRTAAMVTGGFSLVDGGPTDARLARMDREQRVPVAPRAFWHWRKRFDWLDELAAMPCPRLLYVGREDRPAALGIRGSRDALTERGVDVIEFDGLDHRTCEREPALSTRVVPTVVDWFDECVGTTW
ncbi:alpha/beta hydrolase [Actinopolymorpha sp. B11F2]|uniref:alpha/beta fold hydrolase n=1 Tax=Actinopolymorpha sp. B11F2 TaxID=3160862 RepID=UPI0032E37848